MELPSFFFSNHQYCLWVSVASSENLPKFVHVKTVFKMQEKFAALHHIFEDARAKGITIQSIDQNPEIAELATEILGVFGLKPTAEHKQILIDFGMAERCTDELIDATLIQLADEGAYYQTISRLGF